MRRYVKQSGAATLIFSIIVLILVTFVSLYSAKSIIVETKIFNNDLRSKQAFEAAEAGVNEAFSQLKNRKRVGDVLGLFGHLKTPNSFANDHTFTYKENPSVSTSRVIGSAYVEVKSSGDGLLIISTGYSDDKTSERTITVFADNADAIANVPDNPLTAKGIVSLTGSVDIYNQEGASTIWSGGAVNATGNGKTYIASPADSDYPKCMDNPFDCEVVISSDDGIGVDVIANDTSLGNLSDDELFQNFFGLTKNKYRASGAVDKIINNTTTIGTGDEFDPQEWGKSTIWVDVPTDETFSIPAGTVFGCTSATATGAATYIDTSNHCEANGGVLEPVILIVDGNVKFAGNAHIYGLMFVSGDVISAGTPDITGGLIATGSVGENGSVAIRYNSDVIGGLSENPQYFVAPGGWKDF